MSCILSDIFFKKKTFKVTVIKANLPKGKRAKYWRKPLSPACSRQSVVKKEGKKNEKSSANVVFICVLPCYNSGRAMSRRHVNSRS